MSVLTIVAAHNLDTIDEELSQCEPESYYFLAGMAELNGDKPRELLDIISAPGINSGNVGNFLSRGNPHIYYILKAIQEYADT